MSDQMLPQWVIDRAREVGQREAEARARFARLADRPLPDGETVTYFVLDESQTMRGEG